MNSQTQKQQAQGLHMGVCTMFYVVAFGFVLSWNSWTYKQVDLLFFYLYFGLFSFYCFAMGQLLLYILFYCNLLLKTTDKKKLKSGRNEFVYLSSGTSNLYD